MRFDPTAFIATWLVFAFIGMQHKEKPTNQDLAFITLLSFILSMMPADLQIDNAEKILADFIVFINSCLKDIIDGSKQIDIVLLELRRMTKRFAETYHINGIDKLLDAV